MEQEQPKKNGEETPRRISSSQLFNGGNQVIIEHKGQDYLLRETRQGKLILTK